MFIYCCTDFLLIPIKYNMILRPGFFPICPHYVPSVCDMTLLHSDFMTVGEQQGFTAGKKV